MLQISKYSQNHQSYCSTTTKKKKKTYNPINMHKKNYQSKSLEMFFNTTCTAKGHLKQLNN
ncbi:hypothetical protein Syun_020588 [Stephania yunnanensis]|uniref:Uncharacterized protein n=1 Tax=Stephania yunnanensis TaxID=152371 RepID=A0AAP0IFD1_9MAGN